MSAEQTSGLSCLWPSRRGWNIALRTAHIAVTGILFGGHYFEMPPGRLVVWLSLTILTGAILILLEAWPRLRWCHQGRGIMVMAKLLLLCLIPWLWNQRVWILVAVIILASVGSHMPARFRYWSVIYRRVLD